MQPLSGVLFTAHVTAAECITVSVELTGMLSR